MSVQTTYNDFPDIAFPGQLCDMGNSHVLESRPAEGDIPAGVGVAAGTAITDLNTQEPSYVKLPDGIPTTPLLGIAVRIASLAGEPANTQASVATYRAGSMLTFLVKGAIYVRATKAVAANNTQVYVVDNAASSYDLGTLLPDIDSGNASALTGAFFQKATPITKMVKVTIR